MTADSAAQILYMEYNKGRYAPNWGFAQDKQRWRDAAHVLLSGLESERKPPPTPIEITYDPESFWDRFL